MACLLIGYSERDTSSVKMIDTRHKKEGESRPICVFVQKRDDAFKKFSYSILCENFLFEITFLKRKEKYIFICFVDLLKLGFFNI